MAKPDKSIDPLLLESARAEFLKHGFQNASLKEICQRAGVTTGALYKRYKGKEELFEALVAPTVADLNQIIAEKRLTSPASISDEALIKAWDMDEEYMLWWFEFLYQRHDGFVLLLRCSETSAYSNFAHDWVEVMTQTTFDYYKEAVRRKLAQNDIGQKELHVLLSAFWTTIYEPFIHDFTWEEIVRHSHIVCLLFDWYKVLGFQV